jgi:hypothetical protein
LELHTHSHTHAHTHTHTNTHTHAYTHTLTHTYAHTYTHTLTHTYAHTHTPGSRQRPLRSFFLLLSFNVGVTPNVIIAVRAAVLLGANVILKFNMKAFESMQVQLLSTCCA